VGLGLTLFSNDFSRFGNSTLLWVYLGEMISLISWYVISALIKSFRKFKGWKRDGFRVIMDKDEDESVKILASGNSEPSPATKWSHISFWISAFMFISFELLFVLVLVVLVALPW
jgi:hypothetical protein